MAMMMTMTVSTKYMSAMIQASVLVAEFRGGMLLDMKMQFLLFSGETLNYLPAS
jgi:hypothetical protein